MIHNIFDMLDSGRVRRWHCNPDMADCGEDNAQHQWHVAVFVLWLKPEASRELLIAALTHDTGELMTGDLPYPVKSANPEMYQMHEAIEREKRLSIIKTERLTEHEINVLKAADRLAAWDRMLRHAPGLRHRSDWRRDQAEMLKAVESLYQGDRRMYAAVVNWMTMRDAQITAMRK